MYDVHLPILSLERWVVEDRCCLARRVKFSPALSCIFAILNSECSCDMLAL